MAADLRRRIASGEFAVGLPFLSRAAIGEQYGIAHMTAGKVVEVLVDEGLLEVHQGVLPRVLRTPEPVEEPPVTLESLAAQLTRIEAKLDEALRAR